MARTPSARVGRTAPRVREFFLAPLFSFLCPVPLWRQVVLLLENQWTCQATDGLSSVLFPICPQSFWCERGLWKCRFFLASGGLATQATALVFWFLAAACVLCSCLRLGSFVTLWWPQRSGARLPPLCCLFGRSGSFVSVGCLFLPWRSVLIRLTSLSRCPIPTCGNGFCGKLGCHSTSPWLCIGACHANGLAFMMGPVRSHGKPGAHPLPALRVAHL